MDFRYEVIRLWTEQPRKYLRGGLGLLPLAPRCVPPRDVSQERLQPIVDRVMRRLERDAIAEQQAKLLAATYLLTGIKVERDVLQNLFREAKNMKESSANQAILEEGKVEKSHETILTLGADRLGTPSQETREAILGITDLPRLVQIEKRLLHVATWDQLLASD